MNTDAPPQDGSVERPTLARCVGDPARFANEVWAQRAERYTHPGGFEDLLSIDAIDEMLELTARRPTFRLVRDGATLSPATYTRSMRLGGATVDEIADVGRIAELVTSGATLVLQGLERTHAPVREFCATLHDEICHPVQANAYLSPPSAHGLARHADEHDVLVLQIVGDKSWDVDSLGTIVLEPGDVLYLPRRTFHAASTSERSSLHLTVGIPCVTYRDVVRRALAGDETLDEPLPIGFADPSCAAVDDGVRRALATATSRLSALDPQEVLSAERRRVRPAGRRGHLGATVAAFAVDSATIVRCRPDETCTVERDDDKIVIVLADRRIHLPQRAETALDQLLAGTWVRVGELRGLNASSRVVVARRLIREGVLVARPHVPANDPSD